MASVRLTRSYPQKKRISLRGKEKKTKTKTSVTEIRKATPVSPAQKELNILKEFDLTLEYGPCIGITRLERWERAEKHGLSPPAEVKEIISRNKDDETFTECLWNHYTILK